MMIRDLIERLFWTFVSAFLGALMSRWSAAAPSGG